MILLVDRVGQTLDWCADNVGNVYFLAMAAIVAVAIVGCVTVAVATGTWALLAILALPGFWLLMWLTD